MNKFSLLRTFCVSLVVLLLTAGSPVFADTTSSTTSPSTTSTAVGPQGAIGPQGTVGPEGTVGPDQPVGPQPADSPLVQAVLSNSNTGPNSSNQNSASQSSSNTDTVDNTAAINNNVQANLGTGNNTVQSNTQVNNVQTGSINGAINLINVANSQFAPGSTVGSTSLNAGPASSINLTPSDSRSSLNNNQTGPNSDNQNIVQDNNLTRIINNNQATANNQLGINADTGDNTVTQNSQVGSLKTGDINLAVNVVNLLNVQMPNTQLNLDVYSVLTSNPDATITVPSSNTQTGPNSNNQNNSTDSTNTGITVTQHANTANNIQVNSTTGDNTVTQNGQSGQVATGNTKVDGSTVTVANANTPTFYLVNVFGDWNGSLQGLPPNSYVINRFDNNATGPNSNNQNSSAINSNQDYQLSQNATANNALLVNANTGGNHVSSNTKVGDIDTGSVNVFANLINFLNSWGSDLPSFTFGILNIFSQPAPVVPAAGNTPAPEAPPVSQTVLTSSADPLTPTSVDTQSGTSPQVRFSSPSGSSLSTFVVPTSFSSHPVVPAVSSNGLAVGAGQVLAQNGVFATLANTAASRELNNFSDYTALAAGNGVTKTPVSTGGPSPVTVFMIILGLLIWAGTEIISLVLKHRFR